MSTQPQLHFSDEVSFGDLFVPTQALDGISSPNKHGQDITAPVPEADTFRKESTASAVQELTEKSSTENLSVEAREDGQLSRQQLYSLLENVIQQLKEDHSLASIAGSSANLQPANLKITPLSINDRTEEMEELKSLLIEAQQTIIKLLTDRVEDRSKMATLETQLKLLPITHLTAEEQIVIATKYESLHKQLTSVQSELEQLQKVHAHLRLKQKSTSLWGKLWRFSG